jgi:NAD(P)-dependent dehydrogenase (short-subunit alcohol dehydrogenase family)
VTIPATRADGRLQDRVALVTGGSRSIGAAVAIGYAREGAQVAFSYRTGDREARDIVDRIEQAGGKALATAWSSRRSTRSVISTSW